MSIATELLKQHIETLVNDNKQWKSLIADDIVWELPYALGIGHPPSLSGRGSVEHHVDWFLKAVQDFRFFDVHILEGADPQRAVAEVKAEGIIKHTGRIYRQQYVVFLKAEQGKIASLREYFDPIRAAQALDEPILDLHR